MLCVRWVWKAICDCRPSGTTRPLPVEKKDFFNKMTTTETDIDLICLKNHTMLRCCLVAPLMSL